MKKVIYPLVQICTWLLITQLPVSDIQAGDIQVNESRINENRLQKEILALSGATLIDGRGGPPQNNSVVILKNNRIQSVGTLPQFAIPPAAQVVDIRGKFILPGFVDAHAHITLDAVAVQVVDGVPGVSIAYDEETSRGLLSNMLAHGITNLRNPGGSAAIGVTLRESVRSGELPGPAIVTAGELISAVPFDGLTTPVTSGEQIVAEINRQAAIGVDCIKLYHDLPENHFSIAIEAAHRLGLPAIAHTGAISWTRASQLGIDSLLHIMPISPDLLDPAIRENYLSIRRPGAFEFFEWYEHVDLDSPQILGMLSELSRNQVFVDPTLVMFEAVFKGNDPAVIDNPALQQVPARLVDNWRNYFNMNIGWSSQDFSRASAVWPKVRQLTLALHQAGVPLAVGTDVGNPWIVPGDSFHREMALLVEAGIRPLAVLSMATLKGAELLGIDDESGSVEPGKLANLVILDADPVADINNTRKLASVIREGIMKSPDDYRVIYPREK
jgi:hypothetical protein